MVEDGKETEVEEVEVEALVKDEINPSNRLSKYCCCPAMTVSKCPTVTA
jgi:hypothetical protein